MRPLLTIRGWTGHPQPVLEAVRAARRIKARGGLARQKQYIGKLMRDVDTLAIEAALAQLR